MNQSTKQPGFLRRSAGRVSAVFTFIYQAFFLLSLVIGLALAWFLWSGGPPVTVDDNVGLVLAPTGALVEQVEQDPLRDLIQQWSGEPPAQTAVSDLVDALDHARGDERIAFAVLKLDQMSGTGIATMDPVIEAIGRFRESGKAVYVWSDMLTQSQYLLAAQADEIAINPFGGVWLEGFSQYPNYIAGLIDKIDARVHVFRVGTFKSAVEPFIRSDMSEPARQANRSWLDALWTGYLDRVDAARPQVGTRLPELLTTLPERLESAGGDLAGLQLEAGLIDRLEALPAFRARMGEIVGMEEDGHGSFRQIGHRRYLQATADARRLVASSELPVVAQVTVQGMIVGGEGDIGTAGGDAVAAALEAAGRDDQVRAVVLRIDTPGGSVLASERIRSAVVALRDAGKPVVASMASQAASGGYWIAMDAERIFAHDVTITGSIGVFGLWLTLDESLENIGISTDGVGTTPLAGALRPDRPLSDGVRRILQSGVEHAYNTFITGVAEGRGMTPESVDAVAQGRVWTGAQALERGLIDEIGGLEAAADHAAELAGLDADGYQLKTRLQGPRSPLTAVMQRFSSGLLGFMQPLGLADLVRGWLPAEAGVAAGVLLQRAITDPLGRYALCDCHVRPATDAAPRHATQWR